MADAVEDVVSTVESQTATENKVCSVQIQGAITPRCLKSDFCYGAALALPDNFRAKWRGGTKEYDTERVEKEKKGQREEECEKEGRKR